MNTRGKLALLFADSTLQKYRGHGLHLALIRARLKQAARHGLRSGNGLHSSRQHFAAQLRTRRLPCHLHKTQHAEGLGRTTGGYGASQCY